jgi:hypothetical protein
MERRMSIDTERVTKRQVLFRLEEYRDKKLNDIARAMSQELGVPVSRTSAIGRLIDLFSLPECPADRTEADEKAA